jgi:hypothetical protein
MAREGSEPTSLDYEPSELPITLSRLKKKIMLYREILLNIKEGTRTLKFYILNITCLPISPL